MSEKSVEKAIREISQKTRKKYTSNVSTTYTPVMCQTSFISDNTLAIWLSRQLHIYLNKENRPVAWGGISIDVSFNVGPILLHETV